LAPSRSRRSFVSIERLERGRSARRPARPAIASAKDEPSAVASSAASTPAALGGALASLSLF
jgi:hypothetical protein